MRVADRSWRTGLARLVHEQPARPSYGPGFVD
jgi:hypothetical protein